jgi:hypothetical protein
MKPLKNPQIARQNTQTGQLAVICIRPGELQVGTDMALDFGHYCAT